MWWVRQKTYGKSSEAIFLRLTTVAVDPVSNVCFGSIATDPLGANAGRWLAWVQNELAGVRCLRLSRHELAVPLSRARPCGGVEEATNGRPGLLNEKSCRLRAPGVVGPVALSDFAAPFDDMLNGGVEKLRNVGHIPLLF
jgi:hypothetical protein